jgi:hypothetical protein
MSPVIVQAYKKLSLKYFSLKIIYVIHVNIVIYSLFLEGLCGGGESGPWVPCLEHAAGLRFTRTLG